MTKASKEPYKYSDAPISREQLRKKVLVIHEKSLEEMAQGKHPELSKRIFGDPKLMELVEQTRGMERPTNDQHADFLISVAVEIGLFFHDEKSDKFYMAVGSQKAN